MSAGNSSGGGSQNPPFPGVLAGAGSIQASPIGQMHVGAGQAQTMSQWIGGVLAGSTINFPSLSTDELRELQALENAHKEEAKLKQLSAFKRLAPSMRQNIVDMLEWDAQIDAMDMESHQMSPRHSELAQKNFAGTSSKAWMPPGLGGQPYPNPGRIRLPAYCTAEDLKQAHAERSLEEEVLDVKDE